MKKGQEGRRMERLREEERAAEGWEEKEIKEMRRWGEWRGTDREEVLEKEINRCGWLHSRCCGCLE